MNQQNTRITTIFLCVLDQTMPGCWWQWRRWVCAGVNMLPLTNPPPTQHTWESCSESTLEPSPASPAQPSPPSPPIRGPPQSIGMTTTAPQLPQLNRDMMNAMLPLQLSTFANFHNAWRRPLEESPSRVLSQLRIYAKQYLMIFGLASQFHF